MVSGSEFVVVDRLDIAGGIIPDADGKIYFSGEAGQVFVVKAGREFEALATNEMGETCMATPAISDGMLFFRTRKHVVAIKR